MYKISNNVIKIIIKAMKNKKVKLTVGEKNEIQRSIFQGDSVLPFLFVISMIALNSDETVG